MKINTYLRYAIYTGLCAILFVPLIVSKSLFFPFITGKNFAFRMIVEIIFGLWLVLATREPAARPKRTWLLYAVTTLVTVSTLATIFSVNPYHSFWSSYERMDGLLTQIHLWLYFIVISSVLRTKIAWRNFFNLSLVGASLVSIYAFAQLVGISAIHQGSTRLDASLGNSAYLAVYLLFHVGLAAYLAVTFAKSTWAKVGYGALALIFSIFLYYTETRGTILGLIGGVLLVGLLLAWRGRGTLKKMALGIMLVVIILTGSLFTLKDTSFVKNSGTLSRFASISLREQTTESRFLIWKMSYEGWLEHPVLGWGPESFIYVFNKYYEPALWRQEPWFDRSHNVFFDWLVSAGVLGLLAYLTLFVLAIYLLWQRGISKMASGNKDSLLGSAILLGLLLAYFCHNLFVFDNLISYIMFFSLLAYLATIYTETDPKSDDLLLGGRTYGPTTILIVVTLVVAGGLTCFYVVNLKPFWASQTLIQALSTSDPSAQLTDYQQIFSADTFGSREALEQYLSAGTALLDPKISNQNRSAYSNLAIEQIKTQTALAGNDARLYMVVGGFLTNVGRLDDALVYLNQAQLATPKKPSVYFQLASLYLIKKDNAKALEAVETARRLAPDYPEANVMSALVFIYVGQPDQAAKILQPLATNTSVILDDRLVTALSANHDSELLTWLYEQRVPLYQAEISSNPDDPKTYTALIDAETKLGQSVAAAKVKSDWQTYLEKKLKDHPELRVNYLALADYYQRQGDQAQAIAIINQAVTYLSQLIKTQPAVTTNYLELAKLFVQVNRADLARQVIEQGIKTNPNLRRDGLTFLATLPAGAN